MSIILRRVSQADCDLLFNWANDESVRKCSFNKNKILYEDHIRWFNNRINSNKCHIFILYYNEIPVGQVRVDIEGKAGIISYSIDKDFRGKGLAIRMISLLEIEIIKNKISINKLIGYVKFDNNASQKVFENLMYRKIANNDFLSYEKNLDKRF